MRILITGANGFIGSNLRCHLNERSNIDLVTFTREHSDDTLSELLEGVDWVFHLAGANRPQNPEEFFASNAGLTEKLCLAIKSTNKHIPVVFTSSIQADYDNDYGRSKTAAEEVLLQLQQDTGNPVFIYRLANVFGKWARPNYNSVVATFCHNISHDLPIHINDPSATVRMLYIDDLMHSFMELFDSVTSKNSDIEKSVYVNVTPEYHVSVGELADLLYRFKSTRDDLITEKVGKGMIRALYSTFISYLPPKSFTFSVNQHGDERGIFVEMLKTQDSGQFSFFTSHPGITRGGHYHHSKTEKFLVIRGRARFRFRNILTNEFYEIFTSDKVSQIIETVPGWSHDVTNVSDEELICMLWANEVFDPSKPDTFTSVVG
jgi:UDP-2-acetamido-2,6-beta-L-arabino-hexul-4-ose reductase